MYVLHYAPDNASLVVRLALLELGLPFECRLVDRAARAQKSTAFLALNPVGVIPVLQTPEGPLSETAAILLWLGERHAGAGPAPGFGPAPGAVERGAYLKWLLFVSNTLHADLRLVFHPEAYVGPEPAAQRALHVGATERLRGHLGLLDRLSGTGADWFGGPRVSGLDLYVAVILRWCALYARLGTGWFVPESVPGLIALAGRLEGRASVAAAAATEGLGARPFTAPSPCRPPVGTPV
jgi:glutathione S-transferase